MPFLYTCKHAGDQYRITKLTADLEVESSYLCDERECECPAYERRQRCRHLDMLPRFIARGTVDTGWMYDYDRGGWVDNRTEDEISPSNPPSFDGTTYGDAFQPAPRKSWRRF